MKIAVSLASLTLRKDCYSYRNSVATHSRIIQINCVHYRQVESTWPIFCLILKTIETNLQSLVNFVKFKSRDCLILHTEVKQYFNM